MLAFFAVAAVAFAAGYALRAFQEHQHDATTEHEDNTERITVEDRLELLLST